MARFRSLPLTIMALVICAAPFGTQAGAEALAAQPLAFIHGVASGDVTPVSAVLWTRVDHDAELTAEVAKDSAFSHIVVRRFAQARSGSDFTVNVLVAPLEPGQVYYYRFRQGQNLSDPGTFRTAPRPDQSADVRFTFTGDTDGTKVGGVPGFNSFETLSAARNEGGDFFVYLGDTIYPDSIKRVGGPATTLDQYRDAYKVNRSYANLRNLLGATSTLAIWDDHEVRDSYAGQTVDPALYAIGRRAFLEYVPSVFSLAPDLAGLSPGCAGTPLFRTFPWGRQAEIFVLDTHSCQSELAGDFLSPKPPCFNDPLPTLPSSLRPAFGLPSSPPPGCLATINDPSRTVLGARQKAAFKTALLASRAKFKFVVTPSNIQQLYFLPYDRWEGYAAERSEVLSFIRANGISNVVFLSTDTHANLINEVFIDRFTDPVPIAQEFVTGPVAQFTVKQLILGQPGLGAPVLAAVNSLFDLLAVDCRHLDAYSYATVDVRAASGTATITLKDQNGNVLINQVSGSTTQCSKTLGP